MKTNARRRYSRFGLRSLLLLVLLISPLLAWIGYSVKEHCRERAAVADSQLFVVRNGDFQSDYFS